MEDKEMEKYEGDIKIEDTNISYNTDNNEEKIASYQRNNKKLFSRSEENMFHMKSTIQVLNRKNTKT